MTTEWVRESTQQIRDSVALKDKPSREFGRLNVSLSPW